MSLMEYFKENQEKLINLFGFIAVFVLGFFSGYYYLLEKVEDSQIKIVEPCADCVDLFEKKYVSQNAEKTELIAGQDNTLTKEDEAVKRFVASKNSQVFHKPNCSFAAKIKEENKIWFSSIEEAKSKGFKPHSCVNGP